VFSNAIDTFLLICTALHLCRRYSTRNPSARPSVCQTRELW